MNDVNDVKDGPNGCTSMNIRFFLTFNVPVAVGLMRSCGWYMKSRLR